jgi:hypothetical protein
MTLIMKEILEQAIVNLATVTGTTPDDIREFLISDISQDANFLHWFEERQKGKSIKTQTA